MRSLRPASGGDSMRAQPRRRGLLVAVVGLVVVPIIGKAQRPARVYRIGFVSPTSRGPRNDAFVHGLRELGYVDQDNVVLEMRFADGRPDRLPGLVADVLGLKVDVLVVGATIGAQAAKNATTSIPVVFAGSSDPVAGGIVTNLARPGANITGFSLAIGDGFAGKWLELLKETAPDLSRCAVLWSSSNASAARFVREIELAARALNVRLDVYHAATLSELDQDGPAIARWLATAKKCTTVYCQKIQVCVCCSNGLRALRPSHRTGGRAR